MPKQSKRFVLIDKRTEVFARHDPGKPERAIVVHQNMKASPQPFLDVIAPYRAGVAIAVECIFTWYWLADLCAREEIPFVLGHALYMKVIHGGKAKNDKIDAHKIAALLRGGMGFGIVSSAVGPTMGRYPEVARPGPQAEPQ